MDKSHTPSILQRVSLHNATEALHLDMASTQGMLGTVGKASASQWLSAGVAHLPQSSRHTRARPFPAAGDRYAALLMARLQKPVAAFLSMC